MTSTTISRRARWGVPAIAAAAVIGGFAAQSLLSAANADELPETTVAELVTHVMAADPQPLSGTVVYTADLGLPSLADLGLPNGLDAIAPARPTDLLAGTSTMRVWTDAADRSRITLQSATSEFSVVSNATEAWTYSSVDQAVKHYTVDDPARLADLSKQAPAPTDLPTPGGAALTVLAQVGQSSTLSLDPQTTVAGRSAYQLVLTPKSTTTLVGRITVAIDGKTWNPLKVTVWPRSDTQNPAIELGFTDVTYATPSDQVLTWSTPAGAHVEEVVVPLPTNDQLTSAAPTITTTGTGWDQVATVTGLPLDGLLGITDPTDSSGKPDTHVPDLARDYALPSDDVPQIAQSLLDALSTPVDGGRLVTSSLLSVLVMDDGRVLVGAVPGDVLIAAAR
ncbi:MAG: hypothetical protein FWF02_02850 [Micrococcales bacterium]|nr:hypothetical protein [Micrococcales bacterium]MCL2666628.1 hypothetical protein [Micrococcales bacterium]